MKLSTADLGLFFEDHHHTLGERLATVAEALARDHDPASVAHALGAEHDLYRLLAPEAGPIDVRGLCLAREALAYACPLADAIFAVHGLGAQPLVRASGRGPLLAAARRGDAILGFALTEPEAGSDVASLRATARRESDGWVLDGDKTLISNVGIATHFVVFANADPAAGKRGISAFLVPANAPGLGCEALPMSVDHPVGRLVLRGCRPGADALVGAVGEGLRLALGTLDTFRVTVGAAAVGMARRALDETVAHVRGRSQFGQPLASQQLVQTRLADMATELDAARLLVLRAAHQKDHGAERAVTEVAMAKLYATEAAQRIVDAAVQLHGGLGVVRGQTVEKLYREVRPLRIYEGTSEIQRLIIGRALVGGS